MWWFFVVDTAGFTSSPDVRRGGHTIRVRGSLMGHPPPCRPGVTPRTLMSRDPATPLARKSVVSPSWRFRGFSKGWSRGVGGRALVTGNGTSPRPTDRCDPPDPKPDNPPMKCAIPTGQTRSGHTYSSGSIHEMFKHRGIMPDPVWNTLQTLFLHVRLPGYRNRLRCASGSVQPTAYLDLVSLFCPG
jgi:hypothetical protein